jgi:hypothetical protein
MLLRAFNRGKARDQFGALRFEIVVALTKAFRRRRRRARSFCAAIRHGSN